MKKITVLEVEQPSYLQIENEFHMTVFEIKRDGSVWWLLKNKLVKANTDKKLGKALGEALTFFVRQNTKKNKTVKKTKK